MAMTTQPHETDCRLRIDVWSDVVCPWCHLGLTYLDRALADFEHADRVDVVLRSYELDPGAPVRDEVPHLTRLARKYGTTEDAMRRSTARLEALGEEVGIDFRFEQAIRGNTAPAHRLVHLAREHGLQRAVKSALFAAYFTEGRPIGEAATLREIATEVGLPADGIDAVLDHERYADEVRADEAEARDLGISGVPFFLFDGEIGVGGAQPADRMLRALRTMWDERVAGRAEAADQPAR